MNRVARLIDAFGDDIEHAHADRDETAFHIHAAIVPPVRVDVGVHKNAAIRERPQSSKHEMIRYDRPGQDSVGEPSQRSVWCAAGDRADQLPAVFETKEGGQWRPVVARA